MTAFLVTLLVVASVSLYVCIGGVAGGVAARGLRARCTKTETVYDEKYMNPRRVVSHRLCDHNAAGAVIGVLWPIGWGVLLAARIAWVPTADERATALRADIKRLEKELGVGR